MHESGANGAAVGLPVFEFGPFRLDPAAHTLERAGVELPLPPKLFDVLRLLVEARGRTVEKEQFMAAVWTDAVVEEGSLTRSVSRLRAILAEGGDGTEGDDQYVRTVARRGYRLAVPVVEVARARTASPEAPPEPGAEAVTAPPRPAVAPFDAGRRIRVATRTAPWVAALALLATAAVWRVMLLDRPAKASRPPRSLAVLPFQGLDGRASGEGLGLGLADSLITRLSNQTLVAVRSTSALRKLTAVAAADSVEAGRALAVEAVLEGTVRRVADRYRVNVRLIDVESGTPTWGSTFDEASLNLLQLEDRLTERLAVALSLALETTPRQLGGTHDAEAYEAYLRARFLSFKLAPESFKNARAYLDRALALDPGFARAHSALAYLHVNTVDLVAPPRVAFAAARAAVDRALAIEPRLPDALATLALIEWQFDWQWERAERHFRQALDLAPTDAFVRSQYAFFLASMQRDEESIAESERARALDPLTVDHGITNAMSFLWARRFAEAAERSRRVATVDPNYWLGLVVLGRALEGQGELELAIATYRRALQLEGAVPEALMDFGRALARAGRRQEAEQARRELEAVAARTYAAPFHLAVIDAALGETDRAFRELDQAIDARSWYATWLLVDPSLDPLRQDPRFADRLRRVGFERAAPGRR